MAEDVLVALLEWLCQQLKKPGHPQLGYPLVAACLGSLMQDRGARVIFHRQGGIPLMPPLLTVTTQAPPLQQYYDTCLAIWQLAYYRKAVDQIAATEPLTSGMVAVVKAVSKEKVIRVALLALRNVLAGSKDKKLPGRLVAKGLPKIVQIHMMQQWGDEDVPEQLRWLQEALAEQLQEVSSFEQYRREVLSGQLTWSPVHTQRDFWAQSLDQFAEKDFQILRVLLKLLEEAKDDQTLAIICNDVSQFVTAHPQGRGIVTDIGFKQHVMRFLDHKDREVQKHALKCVQKMMLSQDKLDFMNVRA